MEKNDKIVVSKIDKRTKNIIEKVLKKLELLENDKSSSKVYYVHNHNGFKYLN